jgi:hypothetical protein
MMMWQRGAGYVDDDGNITIDEDEHAAEDPIGRAIARLSTRGRLSGVERSPGLGMSGSVDRHPVRQAENRRLLPQRL